MSSIDTTQLAKLVNEAVQNVFGTMLSLELERLGQPAHEIAKHNENVVGAIGFGGRATGVVHLYLTDDFARTATSTLLGTGVEEVGDPEINDVIGELCNMIGGTLKSNLSDAGFSCQLSLPTVLRGADLQIETPGLKAGRHVECGFRYDGHTLRAVAALKEESAK